MKTHILDKWVLWSGHLDNFFCFDEIVFYSLPWASWFDLDYYTVLPNRTARWLDRMLKPPSERDTFLMCYTDPVLAWERAKKKKKKEKRKENMIFHGSLRNNPSLWCCLGRVCLRDDAALIPFDYLRRMELDLLLPLGLIRCFPSALSVSGSLPWQQRTAAPTAVRQATADLSSLSAWLVTCAAALPWWGVEVGGSRYWLLVGVGLAPESLGMKRWMKTAKLFCAFGLLDLSAQRKWWCSWFVLDSMHRFDMLSNSKPLKPGYMYRVVADNAFASWASSLHTRERERDRFICRYRSIPLS